MANAVDIVRAKTLVETIKHHDRLYFTEDSPEISDEAYDELWFELRELLEDEDVQKALRTTAMPLGEQHSTLGKFEHLVPVLSLDKMKTTDRLATDIEKFMRKHPASNGWIVQPKFDGLTIVIYRNSSNDEPVFVTRGAGQKGENVTHQFRDVEPTWSAALKLLSGEIVKGEALVSKATFASQHSDEFANPRNLAAGAVRTKEPGRVAEIGVEFVAYELLASPRPDRLGDEAKTCEYLKSLGFTTTPCDVIDGETLLSLVTPSDDGFGGMFSTAWRDGYEYPLDGVVVKPLHKPEKLEWNGHHVVGQLAVKYPPAGAETTLREVEWTVGKSGKLTPVAIFDAVTLNGSSVTKASLGSYGVFTKLDLHDGDRLYVVLSNDVIPHVDANLGGGSVPFTVPDGTRVSGQHLFGDERRPVGAVLDAWLSTLGVHGYGRKFCDALADGGVADVAGLYTLTADVVTDATGCSAKRGREFVEDVASTREAPLEKLLEAFKLDGVGAAKAAKACEGTERLVDAASAAGIEGEELENVAKVAKTLRR